MGNSVVKNRSLALAGIRKAITVSIHDDHASLRLDLSTSEIVLSEAT